MTVAELLEQLRNMTHDLDVQVEGCDCIGPAASVTVEPARAVVNNYTGTTSTEPEYVLIRRPKGEGVF